MQPYQLASQAMREGVDAPTRFAKNIGLTAVSTALGTAAGKVAYSAATSIIPKIQSLISPYVPEKFSMNGLGKLDPRLKKFIEGAVQEGYDYDEIRNFIGEKVSKTEKENPPQKKNIIEQYSPELHQFILKEMQSGRSPLEAGALASLGRKGEENFKKVIDKITKEHKTPWSAILESVYGSQQSGQKQPNQPQPEQQQQPQQGGPGQKALMAILDKINQKLGQ